jgi:hypothetical protein
MLIKRKELLLNFRKKTLSVGIPRAVAEALYDLLLAYIQGTDPPTHSHPGITRAMEAQIRIGIEFIPRGFLAREWTTVLEEFSVERADGKMGKVLSALWVDFTDQIWRTRNSIAHDKESLSRQAESESWRTKLEWFLTNPQTIAPRDHWLLNFTREGISQMTGYIRKQLLRNLETVQKAFAIEVMLRGTGQRVITQFFQRVQHRG